MPIDKEKRTTKGKAFVQLSAGANVKTILSQVKGLEMGVNRLKIYEMKPREDGKLSGSGLSGGSSRAGGNSRGRGFGGGTFSRGGFSGSRSDNKQRESGHGGRRSATSFGSRGSASGRYGSFGRDGGFGGTDSDGSDLGGINRKRDQRQPTFSSDQNDNNRSAQHRLGRNQRRPIRLNRYGQVMSDSSDDTEAELIEPVLMSELNSRK